MTSIHDLLYVIEHAAGPDAATRALVQREIGYFSEIYWPRLDVAPHYVADRDRTIAAMLSVACARQIDAHERDAVIAVMTGGGSVDALTQVVEPICERIPIEIDPLPRRA